MEATTVDRVGIESSATTVKSNSMSVTKSFLGLKKNLVEVVVFSSKDAVVLGEEASSIVGRTWLHVNTQVISWMRIKTPDPVPVDVLILHVARRLRCIVVIGISPLLVLRLSLPLRLI